MSGWTDAEVERLKALLADGLSAAKIAPEVGKTRNSVISYVNRHRAKLGIGFANPPSSAKVTEQKPISIAASRKKGARGGFSSIKKYRAQPVATDQHADANTGAADRDAGSMPTCALTPRDDFAVGFHSRSAAIVGGVTTPTNGSAHSLAARESDESAVSHFPSLLPSSSRQAVKPEAVPPHPAVSGEIQPIGIPLKKLSSRDCRYIIAGEGANALFCGDATVSPSCSWCEHHRARVFSPRSEVVKAKEAEAA